MESYIALLRGINVNGKNPVKMEAMERMAAISDPPNEFHLMGRAVDLYCPDGSSHTKLTITLFEKQLGVTATARNWKTCMTVLEMGERK